MAKSGESEQATRVAVVSSDIEVKQPIVLGEIEMVVGETVEQELQQLALPEKMSAGQNNSAQIGTSPAASGIVRDLSDTHIVPGSSEQNVNHVIVVASEIQEMKQFVQMHDAETLVEDVQKSLAADAVRSENATCVTNPERAATPEMATKSVQLSPASPKNFTAGDHQNSNVKESENGETDPKTDSEYVVGQGIQAGSIKQSFESPANMTLGSQTLHAKLDVRDKTNPEQLILLEVQKKGEQQSSSTPAMNLTVDDHDIDVKGNGGGKTPSDHVIKQEVQTKSFQQSSATAENITAHDQTSHVKVHAGGETASEKIVGQQIQKDSNSAASSENLTIDNKCIHVVGEVRGDSDPKPALLVEPGKATENAKKSSATPENLTDTQSTEMKDVDQDNNSETADGSEKTGDKKSETTTSGNGKNSIDKGNENEFKGSKITQRHGNRKDGESSTGAEGKMLKNITAHDQTSHVKVHAGGETASEKIVGQQIQKDSNSAASSENLTIDNKCIHVEGEVRGNSDPKPALLVEPGKATENAKKSSATPENLTDTQSTKMKDIEQRTPDNKSEIGDGSEKTGDKKTETTTLGNGKNSKDEGNENKFNGRKITQRHESEKDGESSTGAEGKMLEPLRDKGVQVCFLKK